MIMAEKQKIPLVTKNDFIMQTFRAGGPGGQHQNKTNSGVRLIHPASGARGESRDERSQLANKKKAFNRLVNSKKFQTWQRKRIAEIIHGKNAIEDKVEAAMAPHNLKIEAYNEQTKCFEVIE